MRELPYDDDLAYVHDVSAGEFAERSAPGLLKLFKHSGIVAGRVVDLGCGTGIWARHLVAAGYQVVGVDISSGMIKLARQRAPQGSFHVESCLKFDLPDCQVVTALGEVLSYMFDRQNSLNTLTRFFRRVFDALDAGGLFVFDIAEIGVDRGRLKTFWEGDDWACLVDFETDEARQQFTRHIVTYRKIGKSYRRRKETHHLQLYHARQLAAPLREIGFKVRTVRAYGDYPLLPKRVGFIARKP